MTAASADDDSSHKPRGFMRAVGGLFHRRSARDSESRHSTLDAPVPAPQEPEQSASAASSVAPRSRNQEDTHATTPSASNASASAASRSRDTNNSTLSMSSKTKLRTAARNVVRNPFRKKSSESLDEVLAASSKDSDGTAPSDDDDDEPAYATQFLFYSGSAEDNAFKPEKVHSTVVEIDYSAIRPSLTLHMPVFFSPPTEQTALRRSSILTDPREYELRASDAAQLKGDDKRAVDADADAAEQEEEKTMWFDGVSF